ncbi:hypothetical protein MTO96_006803 [Rhipicephalus appendiculatus]
MAELSDDYLNVHIICHSHLDAGWLDTVGNIFTSNVQHIYTSVRDSLMKYPQRRFVSAENVFFSRWLRMQTELPGQRVCPRARPSRLQFVGGGWTQNDEAVTHYTAIVDQMTMGLRFLNHTFGECGNVKVAWQIDPFGHSKAFAALVSEMGYDCLVVSRVHHALSNHWRDTKRLEFVWKSQAEFGSSHDMFTLIMYRGTYTVPSEFCVQDYYCSMYDSQSGVVQMAEDILKLVFKQSAAYATNNIAIYIGGDLAFQNADRWFNQVDASIKAVNVVARKKGHRVRATYSTPLCYLGGAARVQPVVARVPRGPVSVRGLTGAHVGRILLESTQPEGVRALRQRIPAAISFPDERNVRYFQACKQLAVLGGLKDVPPDDEAKGRRGHHAAPRCHHTVMSRAVNQLVDASGAAGDLPWRFCHALNVSECVHSAKVDLTETDGEFTLLLYNPSSTALSTYARLPVATGLSFTVQGPQGDEVDTQAVPLIMTVLNIPERHSATKTELTFPVELPPLGYAAYRITAQKKKEEMHFASASLEFLQLEPEQRFIENEVGYKRSRLLKVAKSNKIITCFAQIARGSWDKGRIRYSQLSARDLLGGGRVACRCASPSTRTAWTPRDRRWPPPGGAYSFDPDTNRPVDLGNKVTYRVVQGPYVTEVHQIFDQWLSQVIRLYKNSQFIEFEWIVGPMPSGASTDVTTRYETSLDNDGVFFTDSNGMFTVVRRVNDSLDPASVASSYYPVVSWIYIKFCKRMSLTNVALSSVFDSAFLCPYRTTLEELQMTVIPDRPQGGTSFAQGTIELMLHRRYFIDDDLGVEEPLNDRGINDEGIIVKGRHRLHLGTPKEAADLMRRAALQEVYRPVYMFYPSPLPANARKQHSELRVALPPGGHLMTLEGTEDNRTLVRIENIHQDLTINVSVTHLLHSFLLLDARETVLSAHQYRSEVQRRPWPQTEGKYVAPDESAYLMQQVHGNMLVNIQPGQIRTFLASLKAFSIPPASRAR